jgi:hypothetical protein
LLNPEEILDNCVRVSTIDAGRPIERTNTLIYDPDDRLGCLKECSAVEGANLLTNDPICNRINITADDIAAKADCFEDRRASAHERVSYQ